MEQIFLNIFSFFKKRKLLFWTLTAVIFAVVVLLSTKIQLEEDISKFLPKDPKIAGISNTFSEIDVSEKIIVNLSLSDTTKEEPDELIKWAGVFVDSLKMLQPDLISGIQFKTDDSRMMEIWDFIYLSLPYLLDENDYLKIDSMLSAEIISETLQANKKILISPSGIVLKKSVAKDPLHLSNIVLGKLNKLRLQGNYELFDGCIVTPDHKNLLFFVDAANPVNATSVNQGLIDQLDSWVHEIENVSQQTVEISYFGGPAVAVSNASRIKKDSYMTSIVAVVLIFILLSLYFRRKSTVFFMLVPVLFGVAFSLALLFLIKTKISAIAIGAGSAVFGIAINYSLHFLTHYQHVRSVKQTLKDISAPMTIGSLTTIGAFLSLLFVSSEALQDFGLFSAFALVGTILFVLIVLPQTYSGFTQKTDHKISFVDKVAAVRPEQNKYFLLAVLVITFFLAYHARNVQFDSEFSSINYVSPQLTKAHEKLAKFTDIDNSTVYCIVKGADLNEALANHEQAVEKMQVLEKDNLINSFAGINNLLPSKDLQRKRLELWNSFWESRKEKTMNMLETAGTETGFRQSAFIPFERLVETVYQVQEVDYFQPFMETFFKDFITVRPGKAMVYSLLKTENKGDDSIVNAFKNQEGVIVYDQFYLSKVLVKLLSSDFNFVLFFCGLLVFVFLTISFGRIELSIISFLPMLVGWIWILGLMSLFGVKFNIINIIISTFIFGLGDDFSIFMTEGLMQEYSHKRKSIHSFKTAMLLSAITMIIGIGVLIFAKHPAMKSLGAVTLIGMVTVVVLSYTISPFLFKWLTVKSGKMRPTPLTFRNLAKSIYSFTAFLIGSILLNIIGFFMFAFRKNPSPRRKLKYHKILKFVTGFVVEYMPGVKTEVVNESGEDFEKPAVIICNHQSHIDLMLTMMLTPKVIILTNQWVWNSPFYGHIVKYLDFYPVASGIEDSVDLLKEKVDEGYSILIFPEGTRSADCSIKRFHKGAFFLAETFNIDIVPLMIHGVGHRVTKGELVLKPGKMKVTVLPRISPGDKTYGENYSKRAKGIRRMYKEKYDEIAAEMFTPEYFKNKIIDSYIFKGPATEWYARLSLRANNNYAEIIDRIPDGGNHLDLNCGKGVFPLLLSMVRSNTKVLGFDENSEDILLAQILLTKPETLDFSDDFTSLENLTFSSVSLLNQLGFYKEEKQKDILELALGFVAENGKLILGEKENRTKTDKILDKINGKRINSFPVNLENITSTIKSKGFEVIRNSADGILIVEIRKQRI